MIGFHQQRLKHFPDSWMGQTTGLGKIPGPGWRHFKEWRLEKGVDTPEKRYKVGDALCLCFI
jgi:hypothetical protein